MSEKKGNNSNGRSSETTVIEDVLAVPSQRNTQSLSDASSTSNLEEVVPYEYENVFFEDISRAKYKISDVIKATPCRQSLKLSHLTGVDLFFKKEYMLETGSFKERGARNALKALSKSQKKVGVIAASAGNHALGLAYHGKLLGIPVTLVMPTRAPLTKVENCRMYDANVIIHGDHFGEAMSKAHELAKERGLKYINGYNDKEIIAGQGTCALEILEQVEDIDAIIVPVGGGGLIAGIAIAIKTLRPEIQIIAVESESCPSFSEAMKAGKPVPTKVVPTLADGLAVPTVGANAFHALRKRVDKTVVVKEKFIALAILRLLEIEKAIVEGAGATGFAALISGQLDELKGKRVVCLLCGGNIDIPVIGRMIERGLAADGRLVSFTVSVSDAPGSIVSLSTLIAEMGASVKDIYHERAWLHSDVMNVNIRCVVETKSSQHAGELRKCLEENYDRLIWGSQGFV
eukprot:m.180589 g.180589  ORF g.180589 m.180589 type:complete len:460 (-) comp13577_c0_seq6:3048-4427(-)